MSTEPQFKEFPKIARLNRECIITEKIDGTNGCVVVTEDQVWGQSRNRSLLHEGDAFGFALWIERNKDALRAVLGPGYHFGEWWGSGIQRRYGLTGTEKRFSLFNVERWGDADLSSVPGLTTVPVFYRGPFTTDAVKVALAQLAAEGSRAAPGFMRPEGVVIFHVAANMGFKVTLEKDEERKSALKPGQAVVTGAMREDVARALYEAVAAKLGHRFTLAWSALLDHEQMTWMNAADEAIRLMEWARRECAEGDLQMSSMAEGDCGCWAGINPRPDKALTLPLADWKP